MSNYEFVKTDDGSVGLYDNDVKDIYHSRHGALNESFEKFVYPSGFPGFAHNNKEIRLLDICYGVGYNTKAALKVIYDAGLNTNVHIDALEYNEELVLISPFIKDNICNPELKLYLLSVALNKFGFQLVECINNLKNRYSSLDSFFYEDTINTFDFLAKNGYLSDLNEFSKSFLHNIYYKYISTSMKKDSKSLLNSDLNLKFYIQDARKSLQELDCAYDFVFLDAFTPQKDPTLWTYDFLNLIKSKMNQKSILVTYSNSTPFRSALIELGFCVGKVEINKKQFGTVASLEKNNIKIPLSEYDIGLTKTTGGIVYRDPDLCLPANEIILNRKTKQEKSDRITVSKYKKLFDSQSLL